MPRPFRSLLLIPLLALPFSAHPADAPSGSGSRSRAAPAGRLAEWVTRVRDLRRRAADGDANAQTMLGEALLSPVGGGGKDRPPTGAELDEGMTWLRAGASSGGAESVEALALALLRRVGEADGPRWRDEAVALLEPLAGRESDRRAADLGSALVKAGAFPQAERLLRRLAAAGDTSALRPLLKAMVAGEKGPDAQRDATSFLRGIAADGKGSRADALQRVEAFMDWLLRPGAAADEEAEGLALLARQLGAGSSLAEKHLADRLAEGRAVPPAYRPLQSAGAAAGGGVKGLAVIARGLLFGTASLPPSPKVAMMLRGRLAVKGELEGLLTSAMITSRRVDERYALEAMLRAARDLGEPALVETVAAATAGDDPAALRALARLMAQPNPWFPDGMAGERYWLEVAAEQGDLASQLLLAQRLLAGGQSAEGLAWLKAAAAQDSRLKVERAVAGLRITGAEIAEAERIHQQYRSRRSKAPGRTPWPSSRSASQWSDLARRGLLQGDLPRALLAELAAVRAAPDRLDLQRDLAVLYWAWGQPLEAQLVLEAALEHDSRDARTLYLLGEILHGRGADQPARAYWERFVELGGDGSRDLREYVRRELAAGGK